jgi:type I restriction enzyme, S subunit
VTIRAYDNYRDSGVDWLGPIPGHWDGKKLKFLISAKSGGTPSKDKLEYWQGDVPWASAKDLKSDAISDTIDHISDAAVADGAAQILPAGSVLVLVRGMMLARTFPVVRALVPMAINQDLKALTGTGRVTNEFLAWLLRGTAVETLNRLDEAGHGTKALRMEAWLSMPLPVPPISEQERISAFLDAETDKIDALVEAQRRLIDLLKEKRQAVISHAVTKGLDPAAPTEDSGVEWLGEVPAHWLVVPIRKVAKLESGHTPSRSRPEWWQDCTIPWFSLADVWQIREAKRDYVFETKEMVSELGLANSSARLLPAYTVMLSRTASVGFSAIMGVPMATTQDFANWVCGSRLKPEFLLQVLRAMSGEFRRLMMGSTHNTIYMPDIQSLTMVLPPLDEQEAIVQHVKLLAGRYDELTREAEAAIELLHERRAALISAAVTGKIDVRGLAPSVKEDAYAA